MKEKIERWLNKYIETNKTMVKLSDGPEGIQTCTGYDPEEVHIYKGIEKIAFYLQATITYDPNWDIRKGRMSIRYNGIEIFQLWDKTHPFN